MERLNTEEPELRVCDRMLHVAASQTVEAKLECFKHILADTMAKSIIFGPYHHFNFGWQYMEESMKEEIIAFYKDESNRKEMRGAFARLKKRMQEKHGT